MIDLYVHSIHLFDPPGPGLDLYSHLFGYLELVRVGGHSLQDVLLKERPIVALLSALLPRR